MEGITVGGAGGGHRFWRRRNSDDNDSSDGGTASYWRPVAQPTPQPPQIRTPTPEHSPSDARKAPATPVMPATQHPNTPPPTVERMRVAVRVPTAPAAKPLTPRRLSRLARRWHDGEAWFTVGGVTQAEYDEYSNTYGADAADEDEDGRRRDGLRVEYDPATGDLAVKYMASPVHNIVGDFFTQATYDSRAARTARATSGLRIGMHEFRGFSGVAGLGALASKTPDFCVRPRDSRFPTLAVEVGWSESLPKLVADANLFLTGTGGVTKFVVLVRLVEAFPATYLRADGASAVSHSHAVEHLKHAMPAAFTDAIHAATAATALADHYAANKATLVPPLLGALSGTALVYVRAADARQAAREPQNAKFPGITCIHEIPFLADNRPLDTAATTLRLPLADIIPSIRDADGPAPQQSIAFNLTLLARTILDEIPQMEHHRAVKRARQSIKTYREALATASTATNPARNTTIAIHPPAPAPPLGRGVKRTATAAGTAGKHGISHQGRAGGVTAEVADAGYTVWKKMKLLEEDDVERDAEEKEEGEEDGDEDDDAEDGDYVDQSEEEEEEDEEIEDTLHGCNVNTDGPLCHRRK
ncbi:hypothetical protein DFH27DRAFT_616388 [Peziza echinospora]|nr:hypothetical protein DFH27DRAFT_616388 [Peziza echinospora]